MIFLFLEKFLILRNPLLSLIKQMQTELQTMSADPDQSSLVFTII